MSQPLVLVFYVDVGDMDANDVAEAIDAMGKAIKPDKDKNILQYYIPFRKDGNSSRIECVNPVPVSDESFDKIKKNLDKMTKVVNNLIKHDGKDSDIYSDIWGL